MVDDEKYLIGLCGYIHLNPVMAKLVPIPEAWKYSNYRSCIEVIDDPICDQALFTEVILNYSDYHNFIKTRYSDEGLEPYVF